MRQQQTNYLDHKFQRGWQSSLQSSRSALHVPSVTVGKLRGGDCVKSWLRPASVPPLMVSQLYISCLCATIVVDVLLGSGTYFSE
jgi:hypothetical protein